LNLIRNDPDRFKALARELAAANVDVFFAPSTPMATAAWYAAKNTPIVVATILDPVELDFVKSLARPGTRVTGVTTMNNELTAKRLELLKEIVFYVTDLTGKKITSKSRETAVRNRLLKALQVGQEPALQSA
jgi:ABC-type uncharacterized transport system substrate-binding protein